MQPATCGRNRKTPLTYVRSSVDSARYRDACPKFLWLVLIGATAGVLASCNGSGNVHAKDPGEAGSTPGSAVSVGVVKGGKKNLGRTLTVSSELVPFQEIDVFAKESGFVKDLNVDYGRRVQKDQVLATLEIPELQLQVKEDDAAVKNAEAQIPHAQ